jgi:hypothetical protein
MSILLQQNFGSGGSTSVDNSSAITITTSWTRYTYTVTLGSLAGKTIGTSSYLAFFLLTTGAVTGSQTFDIWGVQLESGSSATPFQTATGTKQGELAACQRYYYQIGGTSTNTQDAGNGHYYATTAAYITTTFPVTMRIAPTCSYANIANWSVFSAGSGRACVAFTASSTSPYCATSNYQTAVATLGLGGWLEQTNANAALTFSAEL